MPRTSSEPGGTLSPADTAPRRPRRAPGAFAWLGSVAAAFGSRAWPVVRLPVLGVAAALGGITGFLLPDLIGTIPPEIGFYGRDPLIKVAICVLLLVFGPTRLVAALPARFRAALAARLRRLRADRRVERVWVPAAAAARTWVPRAGRALAGPGTGLLRPADAVAGWLLWGPVPAALAGACALLWLAWMPNYLTWPWWADTDQFAVAAHFWDVGVRPFRDLPDFDFPGPIYVHYLLGKAFGWGQTVPFNAFDATLVAVFGLALAAWSRRVFGTYLPGLFSYLLFLCVYLSHCYGQVAQRDWHAPLLVLLGIFALEALPGRLGRVASALTVALAFAFRPHEIVFIPALLSAVDEGACRGADTRTWGRVLAPLAEWLALLAVAGLLAFAPLILQGLMDDFLRLLLAVRHNDYNHSNLYRVHAALSFHFADVIVTGYLAVLVLEACLGPMALRGPARTCAFALLGALIYKSISPYPHAYLDQPLVLVRKVALAPLVAWVVTTHRLSAIWRLAGVAAFLLWALPPLPPFASSARHSLRALGPLLRGEDPEELGPGCFGLVSEHHCGHARYPWHDFRRVLKYLREETGPDDRVFSYLWKFPYPTVNGPSGRLTPLPAAGGYIHLQNIEPDRADEFVRVLEQTPRALAVWQPRHINLDFPELDHVLRRCYRLEVRFGTIEIWRRRSDGPPAARLTSPDW